MILNAQPKINLPAGDYISFTPNFTFDMIKQNKEEIDLNTVKNKIDILQKQLIEAKELKQDALFNKLTHPYKVYQTMDLIIKKGYTTYITLDFVESFARKTPACYIDLLENFPRPVYKVGEEELFSVDSAEYKQALQRKQASTKIKQALEDNVFDEIRIMHLDYARFEEEKRRREEERQRMLEKDPIAFGFLRKFPNHLFFIADWEDEFCDLTFEKLIKVL